ncbi:MAG: MFS transporter [Gemmatimonadetes bacterium]|nr:MFS transporter [Gemmatimonadota bacterium]
MKTRWNWAGLLALSAIASYLVRVNITVAGEPIMREYGLSQVEMGRVFSAFTGGYALCMIPAGALADRFGVRRVLLWAASGWVATTLLLAAVGLTPVAMLGVLPAFIALRVLLGVFEAPTFTAAALGVSRWAAPEVQGRANGLVLAAIGVASAAAPPLVTQLILFAGWRVAMLVTAIPALAVAALWLTLREPVPTARGVAQPTGLAAPRTSRLRSRSFIALTASYTLQGYVGYIFIYWFYLYLVQERKFAIAQSQWVSALPWVLTIVSIPLGGLVSDRLATGRLGLTWGRRMVPLVMLCTGGALLAYGAATTNMWIAAFALAVATASVMAVEGPFWATMLTLAGEDAGTAGGIMNLGSNLGGFVSPAVTPMLALWIGWERALELAGLLGIMAGLLWLWVTPGADAPRAEASASAPGAETP